MKNNNNQYGFNSSIDTHVIKNMEWGAVAYLSHSRYGMCEKNEYAEIKANSYSVASGMIYEYKAGCGASDNSSICSAYDTKNGMLTSTTGNIYGVYDMVGGAHELTMSYGGDSRYGKSQFTSLPDEKYYDIYNDTGDNYSMIRSKLGDGIKEVLKDDVYDWYGAEMKLPADSMPWTIRGDSIFSSYPSFGGETVADPFDGTTNSDDSTRLIIIP